MTSFSATVGKWADGAKNALEEIFKDSAQELVRQLDDQLVSMVYDQPPAPSGYKRTGFLRSSLMASRDAMPLLNRENPGHPVVPDFGEVVLVIQGAELGDVVFLGVTAAYGGHVHFGANGRPPRQWVTLVAQRWPGIVAKEAARVRQKYGL